MIFGTSIPNPAATTSRAAATPAGAMKPPHSHGTARRGQDHELGRMAQAFEDMNEPDFHREYSETLILGICALAFIIAGAAFVAAPYILRLLFVLFDWMALAL